MILLLFRYDDMRWRRSDFAASACVTTRHRRRLSLLSAGRNIKREYKTDPEWLSLTAWWEKCSICSTTAAAGVRYKLL